MCVVGEKHQPRRNLIYFLSKQGVKLDLNMDAFEEARMMATRILG